MTEPQREEATARWQVGIITLQIRTNLPVGAHHDAPAFRDVVNAVPYVSASRKQLFTIHYSFFTLHSIASPCCKGSEAKPNVGEVVNNSPVDC